MIVRTLLVVLLSVTACSPSAPSKVGCKSFNSVAWQKADTRTDRRGSMADGLIAQCDMKGMEREQIEQLLGQPTKTNYFKDFDLVYVLGPERGFISIDYEWLVFKLGKNERVASYQLVTD